MKLLLEFVHTSELESLNSLILKYSSKTHAYGLEISTLLSTASHISNFSWLGMLIRSTLAVLDFNNNIKRKGKTSADGKQLYKMKVKGKGSFNIKFKNSGKGANC